MSGSSKSFDFAVIGGGSAGYAAARTAASLGLNTVVIDGAETLGGLCILRGCMPSKALIESANRNLSVRRAAEFGLVAQPGPPDVLSIRDRKRLLIDDFASYRQGQLQDGRFALVRGLAKFTGTHGLEVILRDGSGTEAIEFKTACIASGSNIAVPPMPGLPEAGFWTSDDILDAEVLPSSFVVLGGGAIALEMTHYLEGLGRKVTLIQRSPSLLSTLDKDCGEVVSEAFRKRGIDVYCGTSVQRVERTTAGIRVSFKHGDADRVVEAEEILVATGREAATAGLNCQAAGIKLKGMKIQVDETMRSSAPHIFAAGDVCSPLDVVHIAIQQAEIAAKNAAMVLRGEEGLASMDYRLALFGVFCAPEVAAVGASEKQLEEAGVDFVSASYPFNDHGKSMVMGETEGFVKLLAHRGTGEILGGTVVGPHATELIHEVAMAMAFRSTARQFAAVPHYHPTLSEIWTYPAEDLADITDH